MLAKHAQAETGAARLVPGCDGAAEELRFRPLLGGGVEQQTVELARVDDGERVHVEEQRLSVSREVVGFGGVYDLAHMEVKNGRMMRSRSDGNHGGV